MLLQTIVSLVNLGGQRLGLAPGAEDMRDLDQVRLAIEGVRALLPLLEEQDAEQVRPIRDALSQLQMAYAREAGGGLRQRAASRAGGPGPGGGGSASGSRPGRAPGGARRPLGAARQRDLDANRGRAAGSCLATTDRLRAPFGSAGVAAALSACGPGRLRRPDPTYGGLFRHVTEFLHRLGRGRGARLRRRGRRLRRR